MIVTMTHVGFKELQRDMKNISKENVKKINKETYASGLAVQKKAKENLKEMEAWDLGNLPGSISVDRIDGGKAIEVGPTAPYGAHVEFGTKPHFPPPDALEGWAKRHGFDSAWPICLVIAKRGLPERPYLAPAFLAIVDIYFNNLKEILKR